ncbi:phage holin family protein [Nibrella viscosa]|uniref:Phage holin family protein n=1 Tax=Nibrella viscosa TaxID=1084524 RepID=A0ABP8L354_9BACT
MSLILRLLVSAVAVLIAAYIIPGVSVDSFITALIVAVVLGLLNAIVKPILVILTIPITILTLGLFYLVINVLMVYLAAALVSGFAVSGFIAALLFSILVAIVTWAIDSIVG